MYINILDITIHYIKKGKGENVILIHGWGADITYFNKLIDRLSEKYCVYALDLPGFGKSTTPTIIYNTNEYSTVILEFIRELKIKSPTLIGHSFGGKVIIDLVTKNEYNPSKIILIDSSGLPKKKTFKTIFKKYRYKILKWLINFFYTKDYKEEALEKLRSKHGSTDYNKAKGIMRDILVTVVNENYKDKLKLINKPTLLLWGEDDLDTPLYMGRIMNNNIKNSGLVIIKKASHFPFITHFNECAIILENFLES